MDILIHINVDNYVFLNKKTRDFICTRFLEKVRVKNKYNQIILTEGMIMYLGESVDFDYSKKIFGVMPYIHRLPQTSLCGTHPKIIIINDFYDNFSDVKSKDYFEKTKERLWGEIVPHLDSCGKILTFSTINGYEKSEHYGEIGGAFSNFFPIKLNKKCFVEKTLKTTIRI